MFYLKYVVGLTPPQTPEEFTIGTIYHALMDGIDEGTIKSWGDEFVEHFEVGKKLYVERTRPERPPMAKDYVSESEAEMPKHHELAHKFTSKPDRIEGKGTKRAIREFKTAGALHDEDGLRWAIDGQIIGEMMTTGIEDVTVDIITKGEDTKVRQIQVSMNERKKQAWEFLIKDLSDQIKDRVTRFETAVEWVRVFNKRKGKEVGPFVETLEDKNFPRHLPSCVSYGGVTCQFYDYCWTKGASKLLFKKQPKTEWRERLLK